MKSRKRSTIAPPGLVWKRIDAWLAVHCRPVA
jgi:hypothetical protein